MAHHIYQTECFIIGSRLSGDTSRIYYLLTPNLGLLSVKAQGVRDIKSKLRYHLTSFSFARVSLVRGKETWRLVGAESDYPKHCDYRSLAERRVVARMSKFLYSMIHGEESDHNLYLLVRGAIDFMMKEKLDDGQLSNLEVLVILRALRLFGYQKELPELEHFVDGEEWSKEVLSDFAPWRERVIGELNDYFAQH
jgi:recombinational DNA repair protein (RecF pathway)